MFGFAQGQRKSICINPHMCTRHVDYGLIPYETCYGKSTKWAMNSRERAEGNAQYEWELTV